MASNTLTEPDAPPVPRPTSIESAPSRLSDDAPRAARLAGSFGVGLVLFGAFVVFLNAKYPGRLIGTTWGWFSVILGTGGLIFHAVRDRDQQVRRGYLLLGFAGTLAGVILVALALTNALEPGYHWTWVTSLALSLSFLMAAARHETDPSFRRVVLGVFTLLGAVGSVVGLFLCNRSPEALLYPGSLLTLFGLAYLWASVSLAGPDSDFGHSVAVALGVLGLLVVLYALGRSFIPDFAYARGWIAKKPTPYLVPMGIVILQIGLLYAIVSLGFVSEMPLAVLTKRELLAYFYSPIAYLVIIGWVLAGWFTYINFVGGIREQAFSPFGGSQPIYEPIVRNFIFTFLGVVPILFIVPAITMRLFSEEQRSGTIEVLLTAPVGDGPIVLSKFLAALFFFMILWATWGLFLVALRIEGGAGFDPRPLLGFELALLATGSAMIAIGVFFSSLTRNQIVSAVLSFVAMVGMVALLFLSYAPGMNETLRNVFRRMSFLNLWMDALEGNLPVRGLILQGSVAVFFLFLTAKVLESRRWR